MRKDMKSRLYALGGLSCCFYIKKSKTEVLLLDIHKSELEVVFD
jgi:hypothetical protein